jgi:hypothetical protein
MSVLNTTAIVNAFGGSNFSEVNMQASVEHNTATRISLSDAVLDLLDKGTLLGIEASGDGGAGLSADGRLVYRPAKDFVGAETVTLRVAGPDGAETRVSLDVSVTPGLTDKGWARGEHYVLAQDAEGWSVAEAGDRHRVVYVSPDGDPRADGLTPETAITPDAVTSLFEQLKEVPGSRNSPMPDASWHVLYERDHYYGEFEPPYLNGESPLHPFVIGAWGEGERPLFNNSIRFYGHGDSSAHNILIRDIAFGVPEGEEAHRKGVRGVDMLGADHSHIMYENVVVSAVDATPRLQSESTQITLYRTMFLDAHKSEPVAEDWRKTGSDRISGLYAAKVDGLLILDSLADHNAWQAGYDPTGAYSDSQPPSMFSHNFYLNRGLSDLSFIDTISSRGASFGAQIRSSGMVSGNVFFDNNIGMNMLGGEFEGGRFTDNMGLLIDSIITHAGMKEANNVGARGWGSGIAGPGLAADVIVANDGTPIGFAIKGVTNAFNDKLTDGVLYETDGLTIFNWGEEARQTPLTDAQSAALAQVAMDAFAALTLGKGADAVDLIEALRARDRDSWADAPGAQDIVAFFRDGFGYALLEQPGGRVVRFEGDDRADGFRWDNRLNWTGDLTPGDGDRVLIDGAQVTYGLETLTVAGLDLGQGGALRVTQALLEVAGDLTVGSVGGSVSVSSAGQFLFEGYRDDDLLTLSIAGGRAVNTGVVEGRFDAEVSDGQFLLAEGGGRMALAAGTTLTVQGDDARLGFDGRGGEAALRQDGGVLRFVADATGVSAIREFASGRHGAAAPEIDTVFEMRGGTLEIDLSAYDPRNGWTLPLIELDRLAGDLSNLTTVVSGLPSGYSARVAADAATGVVRVELTGPSGTKPPVEAPSSTPTPKPDPKPVPGPVADPVPSPVLSNAKVDWSKAGAAHLAAFDGSNGLSWDAAANWIDTRSPILGDWVQLRGEASAFADVAGLLGLRALNFGDGGALAVSAGVLEVQSLSAAKSGGAVAVSSAGQFVFGGYSGANTLSLNVDGGRAVNVGTLTGRIEARVTDGQFLLAENGGRAQVSTGSQLTISGSAAEVGFDGAKGQMELRMDGGVLRFVADAQGVSAIREFASGRNGEAAPEIDTVFNMRGGRLEIDLGAYDPRNGRVIDLIDLDQLTGQFGALDVVVTGAPRGYEASVTADAARGLVRVELTGDGGGAVEPVANVGVDWSKAGAAKLAAFDGGDSFLWSDRDAWTGDRPPALGDWVQLRGAGVTFDPGADAAPVGLRALNLGLDGSLSIKSGVMETLSLNSSVGDILVSDSGQFIFSGYTGDDLMTMTLNGGRIVNTGTTYGRLTTDVSAGQLLLAENGAKYRVDAGTSLTIRGDDAWVGFDGAAGQEATLWSNGGMLRFVADATGVSTIAEFSSGRHGDGASEVLSRFVLNGGALEVNLSDYDPRYGQRLDLIDVDVITGSVFDSMTAIGTPDGYAARFGIDRADGIVFLELDALI